MTNAREERGRAIAQTCKLTRKGKLWLVPSQSKDGAEYTVNPDPTAPRCSCPDHLEWGHKCKHVFAVEFYASREEHRDGTVTETRAVRITYSQNWPAYNTAQMYEKRKFLVLLRDLLTGVPEPEQKRGRPRCSRADGIFSACYKVFSTVSGRRFTTDLIDARDKGFLRTAPHYNSVFRFLEDPKLTPILKAMVVRSSLPLKAIETDFAVDSTGFSTCRFEKWFDYKYGEQKSRRAWVKAHCMTGVKTNVITAVEIEDQYTNDCPMFAPLVQTTAKRFMIEDISADKAYSSHDNFALVAKLGGEAFIPFKEGAVAGADPLWNRMLFFFQFHREAFAKRYHKRSNVESTFSMVKAKFRDSVRSKTHTAQVNEVLCKLVCHNIVCLISAMYELGIDPVFEAEWTDASEIDAGAGI